MDFLKDLSVYLIIAIIIGLPSFFWVKWAFRSFNSKRKLDFIIASTSYLLFISGWGVILLAPKKYFKHDASESAIFIYSYFLSSLVTSFFILILYFLIRTILFIVNNFQRKSKNYIHSSNKI